MKLGEHTPGLRHRLVLSYDALADDIPADQIVARIMSNVPMPSVASRQGATPNGHVGPNGQAGPTSGVPAGSFDTQAHPQPPQGPVWPGQQ